MLSLLPYAVRSKVNTGEVGGIIPTPSTTISTAPQPIPSPIIFPPGSSPDTAADRVLYAAGDSAQIGWEESGALEMIGEASKAVTLYNYKPSFCSAIGTNACEIVEGSVSKFTNFQCVGFTMVTEKLTGGDLEPHDAKNYCLRDAAPPGYVRFTYNRSLSPPAQLAKNDYVVWTKGKYGHIALVTNVWEKQIEVYEANWGVGGSIRKRLDDPNRSTNVGSVECVLRRK
jgi:hypothetical protein